MEQAWDAGAYRRHAGFVSDLGAPVLDLLAPVAGERILDLGCGDGALSEKIAGSGAIVVGVDSSPAMVEAACRRGLDARQGDGASLDFSEEFDAVFSNAALHWMRNPDAVIAGVRRALKPRGRFVGEFGGHGNVAAIVVALRAVLIRRGVPADGVVSWYFPTVEDYRGRLERHGFAVSSIALIPRPTRLPTDVNGWLDTFAGSIFSLLPADQQVPARDEVVGLLRPVLSDGQGNWTADYVRLRFSATR